MSSTISDTIVLAFQSYQTGNLSQAQLLCFSILQQQPDSTEALHMLGMIAYQTGKLEQAIIYYRQLIALMPDYGEVYYYLGSALHSSGQLADAITHYQKAIALNPAYVDAYYDLGNAFQDQGNLSAAIEQYQKAIALNPNDAEAHCNLANAFLEQNQIDSAIAHYQQGLALRPNTPGIYYNLGNAFRRQNQLDAAINHYRWAIRLDPNHGEAYLQLSKALHASGKLTEAIFYYQQAILLQPNSPDAYYNLGNALIEQGNPNEALTRYQQALTLKPNFLEAHVGLGCALIYQSQLEEAAACLQQALALNPEHPEALHNLAIARANQNQLDEATHCYQKVLQIRPDIVQAYWQQQLLLPTLYDSQEQIYVWRQRFCRGLNNLIQKTALNTPEQKKQALTGLVKSAIPFYLGYQGLNDRAVQRKYGTFVHRVVAANYPHWANPLSMPPLSHTNKIRVGYLSAHFREHTVAKLTLGWLKNCDRQRFEIYTYHIGQEADLITQQFRSYSDGFVHVCGSLEAVCQQIIADKLHILVFTDIGMDPRTTQIAGLRLAPVQCTTWGHPVTSGLPTIDYFLSSDLMEPKKAQAHYSEQLVRLPNIGVCYEKRSIAEPTKTRSDFGLRQDAVIYLSCQSLFKYLPQFDYIFAKIAKAFPQSQFAFLSSHIPEITAQFKARLERAFAGLGLNYEDYCVVLPRLTHSDYVNLNLVSDIFLDTFSWSGGHTTLEAIACGLPVVTCPGEFMRSRHAYGILKMMGVRETIAQDEAEYIAIAVRLGRDAEWRQHMVQKICDRHSWLYDDRTCVTALESFYEQVVQKQLFKSYEL